MKAFALILLSVFGFVNVSCQPQRTSNWNSDIDFLVAKIKEQHYLYKNADLPAEFTRKVTELKSKTAEYSDERMLIELQALMFHLGDGHSYILPLGSQLTQSRFLPVSFFQFSEGLFITDADDANSKFIGRRVISIAGIPSERLMKDMETFISCDNSMGSKWIGPTFIRTHGLLERYGLAKESPDAELQLEDAHGKRETVKLTFTPVRMLRGIPKLSAPQTVSQPPLYLSRVADPFWLHPMPEKNAMYFQFNQVINSEKLTIAEFAKFLDAQLKSAKPALLVIDVRHNNGGNSDLTPPLIQTIKDFETQQNGKIVVLTGRNTFSAAQIFINRLEKQTKAIFAGEISSSKPNFVGEENEVVLPYSSARGSISNRYHETTPGDKREWIKPELEMPPSAKDYFAGKDALLDEVLKRYGKLK